ncbi:interphotoreceptor matrix proteoglycan 2 isoform X3 [Astatotilapia calliptera]|uniref:interphotoreceptor matrix proteoglycan 2 isoform X3 n=1 Tax=Astatotilapia calliptera TaxID=8154 RepID=UPI000E4208A3|nr:interphotoreceptor matrix proteoglycan 2 isoform X3 [Astatotilapia calliptera]
MGNTSPRAQRKARAHSVTVSANGHGSKHNHGFNMSILSWKCVFYPAVFGLMVIFLDLKTDAMMEGSSMGYLDLPYTQEPVVFPRITHISEVKPSRESHAVISRQKRNILFPSGVKLCAQETAEQVIANHLSYFHLRVCQETIWEAFKIFWDRLPEQEEYQSWMSRCQEGIVSARDIGSYFSTSEEHQTLAKKRMSLPSLKSTPTPDIPESVEAPELEDTAENKEEDSPAISPGVEESPLYNDITVQPPTPAPLEQVVELSILLSGEMYNESLADPASLQYQTLSRQLAEKIEDALEGLPGFKSVSVTDFRPQDDAEGRFGGLVVDYAVTVVVNGAGVTAEQLNYLTLQSNQVENSYREFKEHPTVVLTISEDNKIFIEDLDDKKLESVSEIPHSINTEDGAMISAVDKPPEVLTLEEDIKSESSETNTVATIENNVIVLEESEVASPALDLTFRIPEAAGIEKEGLLLEDTVQIFSVEPPPPEDLPAELPGSVTLPEPPVEIEASGSVPDVLEGLIEPSTITPEEEEMSLGETASEEEVKTEEITINADVTSGAEEETFGPTAVPMEEENPDDVVEIIEELEIFTVITETKEEKGLPAQIPIPDAVDITSEASQPEPTKMSLLPVGDNSIEGTSEESNPADIPPDNEEANTLRPENSAINVLSASPEEPVFEENGLEESVENQDHERNEEALSEAPVVVEEPPETPEISREDLTDDEILLVNKDVPEPPVTDSLGPAQPTALSPERESPFTRISYVNPDFDDEPDTDMPLLVEIQTTDDGLDDTTTGDHGYNVVQYGYGLINHTEEGSTGFPIGVGHGTDQASIAMPVNPGRALMVFFSLRVTNMIFSEDLFNKSSPEYKALEQRFLELLVPYLQSNLSHFENLEILNFRNGSIVVNSRMKFGKPVARGVTTTVYLILEDFCNTAYQTMNLAIDKYSLDVESGDQADPCKFQACNEYAECKVNKWSGEAECVCNAGYFSVDGLPCQSICELQTDFCLNDGKCDVIPGQGAICRCRVGENWWYRGEHCEEYVSEPLVVGIAIASVAGFLLVASGVIFFLARTLRDQYDKDESEDPIRRAESLPSLERATKYNPMYESEATTGYSHYYRRYPEAPVYSSASAEASTDFSSEEIRHIYENSELTREEIQDRIRIIELYAKDRQFADFVRQHQAVLDTQRESSSTQI